MVGNERYGRSKLRLSEVIERGETRGEKLLT